MFALRAPEEDRDGTWVPDQQFLSDEMPGRGNGGGRTRHFEVINIHEKKDTGRIMPIHAGPIVDSEETAPQETCMTVLLPVAPRVWVPAQGQSQRTLGFDTWTT